MKTHSFKVFTLAFLSICIGLAMFVLTPAKARKTSIMHSGLPAEVTKNIEFDFAKAGIRADYYRNLNKLALLLSQKNYAVSLRGHADSIGTYVGNWKLSDKRALAVKNYLVSKGVDKSKIITTPYGSTIPIASNKTEEGRQKNRRVEIKLKEIE